jgi:hypothetical protein
MYSINTTRNNRSRLSSPPGFLDNRGSAIVLVVAVAAVVTLLVMTWVTFSVRRYHASVERQSGLCARYAAESVVSKALYGRMTSMRNGRDSSGTMVIQRDTATLRKVSADSNRTPGAAETVCADSLTEYTDSVHKSEGSASLAEEGSFLKVKAEGRCASATCAIEAQFGLRPPPEFNYALVLTEQNKQLEIRGGRIVGDVHLVKAPLGPVQGKVRSPIEANLPKIGEDKIAAECAKFEAMLVVADSAETGITGSHVFYEREPPPVDSGKPLFVNGNILIENRSKRPFTIKGPGVIIAAGDIQISGPTTLDDVTLVALGKVQCFDDARLQKARVFSKSLIGFSDDVRASGDFFAYEKFICAGRATVEQPSFVYVKGTLPPKALPERDFAGIEITQQARFTGTAVCSDGKSISAVERDARFTGLFYTHGQIVVQGVVFGCVAAAMLREAVMLRGPEQQWKNILAGGTINRNLLPKTFVVPVVFGQQGARFSLLSWSETMARGKPAEAPGEAAHE